MTEKNNPQPQMPLANLKSGDRVDSLYHLVSVEQRTKKNGDPFFMLRFADASGQINAVMWDNHLDLQTGGIIQDNFVHVMADCGEFNGNPQLTVKRIVRVEDTDVDISAFLPVSPRDRVEMEKELDEWIARVKNEDCRRLLDRLFGHEKLRELYCTAPAAVRIHQAYVHGLLEHTLNVMKIADSIASLYEPVNRDILITAGLLHDIGKIRELDWKRTITYTTEGRLLGHIPMGASMIDSAINELRRHGGFDPELQQQIVHVILSHHGKMEWGSPITPKTREAVVLHYADHTEAYMTVFDSETKAAQSRGELWTSWNRIFESYLYVGKGAAPASEALDVMPEFPAKPRSEGPADDVYPVK